MRTRGVTPGGFRLSAALLPLVVLLCVEADVAWGAGLVGGAYSLNWDNKVDKKDSGTTETRTLKQTLDVGYRGFLQPVIQNELTLKVEQEKDQTGKNLIRLNPMILLGYKGAYWSAGGKRTVDESNEPDKNPKIQDTYFVELFLKPPRATLPDLKAKYTLDKDYEQDAADTSKHSLLASSVYSPLEVIQFKGDYTLNRAYDFLKPDSDTQDDKATGLVGIRLMLTNKIKFNSEYKAETSKGWTILDAGGRSSEKKDTDQTWKNTLAFRPFGDTGVDASYDYQLKQNKMNGEDSITGNLKVAATQKIANVDLKAEFARGVTEPRNTSDDNRKTEDTWTADANIRFTKLATFTLKYQDRSAVEVHFADPAKNTTSASVNYGGSWSGDMTTFWKASASYDRTDSYTKEIKTAIDRKYSLKTLLDIKAINLNIDASYDVTSKEDLVKTPAEESETTEFKSRLAYKLIATSKIAAAFTHTYGRKTDSLANNIQRTDDTAGNVIWRDPLPGWNVSLDVTRAATDTSGDDLPPDINSSVGFKADFKTRQLAFSTSYKYDIKTTTDNSETFDAKVGWQAPRWGITLGYTFNKTFSEAMNQGYSLNLAFQCNLQ